MRFLVAVLAACLASCTSGSAVRVDRVTPDVGPLAGGTRITIEGDNFPSDARVVIGDREAPLAAVSHDGTKLDVVIPPGDRPGPATLTVIAGTSAAGTDTFRYAAMPTITAVSPPRVVSTAGPVVISVIGSGFVADGAGAVIVLVDGVPVPDVVVESDTKLAFVAPAGPMFAQPTIHVLDDRGTARYEHAFRYVPSVHPGLLLFPTYANELVFYDLVDKTQTTFPRSLPQFTRLSSVYVDGRGDYWAIDRGARFGRLDMRNGQIADPVTATTDLPAMTLHGGSILGIDRYGVGTLDPTTGMFVRDPNATIGCCGSFGIAADGDTVYVTSRASTPILRTFDVQTSELGAPVTLLGSTAFSVEELRVIDHVLYATSRDGTLCTIDPITGAVTVLASIQRTNAFDVVP